MSHNLTDELIDVLHDLRNSEMSDAVGHQARRCLLDYLGVTLAGSRMLGKKGEELMAFLGEAGGPSTLIGMGRKTGVLSAAFINGLSAHVAELDDGVNSGIVHPGAPVFSALLALAEKENVRLKDFIAGIIIGYEATIRMADAIQPAHKRKGYHATGTCGTIGAAMGIAAMLGFSKSETKDAFSSAAISASGTLKALDDASQLKPYNAGRAAMAGLLSASMAKAGFLGPVDVLSGNTGFLSVMTAQSSLSCLERTTGEPLGIERVYVKPYAACRYCHPAIEASLKIHNSASLRPETIQSVKVATYQLAVTNHDHTEISGVSSAKMSIPYSVAIALVSGRAGMGEFTPAWINHPGVAALTKKISVVSDDQLTSLFPKQCCAVVEVVGLDGRCLSERVDFPKGEPENPMSDEELQQKFDALAAYGGKSREEIRAITAAVWSPDDSLAALFALL